ncbi:hypothetical protein CSA08_04490 [Candidatus Gracilibacteria bacterium]|nr:MAG: hypothetical protein CSA08_04490 [Candidatus Gracilibacteria bacterium]
MIKVKDSDTLIDIVNKISVSNKEKIVLDFPFGHQVLHNYLSLKIIKNKCLDKELIIITNDINAKNIGKRIGIKYSLTSNKDLSKTQELLKYNFTFFSFLKFQIKKYIEEIAYFLKSDKNQQLGIHNITKNTKTRIGFFTTILLISISIFTFIFYFAVNKTIVSITPETTIKTRNKNIIFTENEETPSYRNNIVTIKKISNKTSLKETFGTSGVEIKNNKRSFGKAIIYNYLDEEVELIKNTRLKTKSGLLYKIKKDINIKKAEKNKEGIIIPGKIEVEIVAKDFDINGEVIGKNGNIKKGTKLILPGLNEKEKESIYGETSSDIIGGSNEYAKILTKEDIDNSYKIFEEKLKQNSLKELKNKIKQENISNNITYEILGIDKIIKYSDLNIKEVGRILNPGQKRDNFTLSGSIVINTYVYNKNTVINKMRSVIKNSIIEGDEKITFINDKSLRVSNVIYKQKYPHEIKATLQIEVFVSHNFDNEENYYVEKLKNEILGLDKEDAIKILLNDNKISEVNIEIRPFFINKVSNILKNIEFKLK